jgi:hypothetical protein
MNPSTLRTTGGCILALTLGALAGTWRHSPPPVPSGGLAAQASPVGTDPGLAPGRPIDAQLAKAVQTETGPRRWLRLLAASEEATARDMPGLIRAAGKDGTAVRMLAGRWAELDPKHMFRSLHADYLVPEDSPGALPERWALSEALFESWTKSDPAAVRQALTDVPSFSRRENLRMTAINQLMKTDVEQGLAAMREWEVRNYFPDMKKVGEWAAKDPKHAAEVAVEIGLHSAGVEIMKHVGKAWAERDPEGGLQFAKGLNPQGGNALARELIENWAKRDLQAAAKFIVGLEDSPFRGTLGAGLAATWGKADPAAALAWSNENLRGQARAEAVGTLIKAAAEKDISAAAELVAGMEPGPAQNRACASIFESWFNKGKDQRNAAFEWLAGISDPEAREAAFERVQWSWAWNDPAAVKEFISGPYGKLASSQMINQIARGQAHKDPEAAMTWADSLGAERASAAKEAVIVSWLSVRPEAAGAYVRKLPAGPDRERAVRAVSQSLIWQSPQQAAAWYHTLPAAEQKLVREVYDRSGLPPEQREELNKALANR